jgi:hypothetical protein
MRHAVDHRVDGYARRLGRPLVAITEEACAAACGLLVERGHRRRSLRRRQRCGTAHPARGPGERARHALHLDERSTVVLLCTEAAPPTPPSSRPPDRGRAAPAGQDGRGGPNPEEWPMDTPPPLLLRPRRRRQAASPERRPAAHRAAALSQQMTALESLFGQQLLSRSKQGRGADGGGLAQYVTLGAHMLRPLPAGLALRTAAVAEPPASRGTPSAARGTSGVGARW